MTMRINEYWIWALSLLICAAATALSFAYIDVPVAQWSFQNMGRLAPLGRGLGSAVLLSLEAAVVLTLTIVRLVRGHISEPARVVALASLTSMCAYAFNDSVLKMLFGVPAPSDVLAQGARHALHLLAGASMNAGFPSGHMVLAAAFGGVFIELYPPWRWLFIALLSFGAALLIYGDWHFVSDVIAGTFVGVSAGLLAGRLWQVHSSAGATLPPNSEEPKMIRKATRGDLPRIAEIRAAVRENRLTNPKSIAAVPAAVDWLLDNSVIWVWEEHGVVQGFSAADPRNGSIFALFVHPDFEHRGIGQALLPRACDVVREHGLERAWLETEPGTRAEEFYRKDGWTEIRRNDCGQIVFEKRL